MIEPKPNSTLAEEAEQVIFKKWFSVFKKIVTETVLVSLVFSLITPALVYPLEIKSKPESRAADQSKKTAKIDLEELVFKILLADQAKAQTGVVGVDDSSTGPLKLPTTGVKKQYPKKPQEIEVWSNSTIKVIQDEQNKTQTKVKEAGKSTTDAQNANTKNDTKWQVFWKSLDQTYQKLRNAVKVAAAEAFSYMLNTFAYDMATWLASGGKGQQPMFFTEGWGDYLTNLADNAAGKFLEKLGNNSWLSLNLCTPSLGLKISIGLGLGNLRRPKAPDCTITKMVKNWQNMANSPNFLNQFDDIFDPKNNDLGIAAKTFGLYHQTVEKEWLAGIFKRKEGQGFKSVGDAIADTILTPSAVTAAGAKQLTTTSVGAKGEEVKVEYGNIFNIAIATFINTLLGKLFERLFKKGLAKPDTKETAGNKADIAGLVGAAEDLAGLLAGHATNQDLYTGESGLELYSGQKAASLRFLDLLQAGAKQSGPYDILTKLVYCSDPANPGPDECVIKQDFRSAIERKLTLKEAVNEGLIDGNAPFGFMDWDASALYRGISYRSITILRSFRVVPVGWEIAAQAINKFDSGKTYSLNDLMARFADDRLDNLFYGLVDPEWVLTLPDHFCKLEGYGPKVVYEGVIGGEDADGDGNFTGANDIPPTRTVGRAEYCANYQSCLQKDDSGNCQYYGYCTEERRIWDLQGKSCKPYFNTCQTFQRRDNKIFSFLENTLDFNGCSADNVGCLWYCQVFNPSSDIWTCTNDYVTDPATHTVDGERVLKPCNLAGGCLVATNCEIAEGDMSCTDEDSGIKVSISNSCSSGSRWWTGDKCVVDTSCTIKQGDVACTNTGCESFANLLPNPGFEAAAPVGNLADKWTGNLTYFERVAGASERIKAGKNSLRFFSYGLSLNETVSSDEVELPAAPAGTYYTFSGYVYDYLNKGAITLRVDGDVEAPQSRMSTKGSDWQPLTFDFKVIENPANSGKGKVRVKIVVSGDQVGGTAWFDDFKITQSCILDDVRLNLVGTVNYNESKIHLDRDAQSCEAQNAGCSELIRTIPNFGTNLVPNSSFEDWADINGIANGWKKMSNSADLIVERVVGDSVSGNNSVKLTNNNNTPASDFAALPLTAMKPNTTYLISFWAKTADGLTVSPSDNVWYLEVRSDYCSLNAGRSCSNDNDCQPPGFNYGVCVFRAQWTGIGIFAYFKLTDQWQRIVLDPVTTDSVGANFYISFEHQGGVAGPPAVNSANSPLYLDDIQIEEVATANPLLTNYKDYGSVNLVYLKKPPVTLNCHGYTIDRPSPDILTGVSQIQCNGGNMVWRKFCTGGINIADAGETCTNDGECQSGSCQPDRADSCDLTGQFCCHYIDWPECADYAMYCQQDEVGCELYRPLIGGQPIPAKASIQDYCPAECVGYQAYKQSTSYFESQESLEYFIPQTAKSCSASQVGCSEFTNLDEVARGGEGREYYQYLRQCRKPDSADANCQNFYNWQGSDETGYQLKLYSLVAETIGTLKLIIDLKPGDPGCVDASPNDGICDNRWEKMPDYWCADKTVGALGQPVCCDGPEDLAANPFCKEFYATSGEIYYRIYANTISCSEDCHPLRQTRLEKDDNLAKENCTNTNGTWENSVCLYQAIPQQGISCSAAAAGCREYRGNAAGNVFSVFSDNFEDGDIRNWNFGQISSEALSVAGHSIKSVSNKMTTSATSLLNSYNDYTGSETTCQDGLNLCNDENSFNCYDLKLNKCVAWSSLNSEKCLVEPGASRCGLVENLMSQGKTYLISFWAKSESGSQDLAVTFKDFYGDPAAPQEVGKTIVSPEWNYYVFGPFAPKGAVLPQASLELAAAGQFFADNFEIQEVHSYVYVRKNSWQTPQSCDTNPWTKPNPTPAPRFMLGCQQYLDSYGRTHNLKSFTSLCRQEAVGCEALIDTFNSSSPFAKIFNENDALSDVNVPADKLIYLVNKTAYQCPAAKVGCQALGRPVINVNKEVADYNITYLINNPNQYSSSLCASSEVGCEEWQTGDGFSYFKDPGQRVCEYRLAPGQNQSSWFKYGSTAQTGDCPLAPPLVGKPHPTDNWAGLCPTEASSCNQFIDPVSLISKNLIFNADFKTHTLNPDMPDGWYNTGTDAVYQNFNLLSGNLYTLSFTSNKNLNGESNLYFEVRDCPQITSYDHSLTNVCIDNNGEPLEPQKLCRTNDDCASGTCSTNLLALPQGAYATDDRTPDKIDGFPAEQISYSGRFFVPRNCNAKVMITRSGGIIADIVGTPASNYTDGLIKEAALRETDVNYVLADSVDKRSCNGIVDPERQCVLFNDRSQVNYKLGEDDFSYLGFDADTSGISINTGLPVLQCAGNCDSNVILKVRPDRTCETWLDCTSYATVINESGGEERQCLNLGLCDSLADDGSCLSFLAAKQGDSRKDYYQESEQIKNLSGYSRAGLAINGVTAKTISGYYPYVEMTQEGGAANVTNGSFDSVFTEGKEPLGWAEYLPNDGQGWRNFKYNVGTDLNSALEGGYLQLNTSYQVVSEDIDLEKGVDYILSGWLNTLELKHNNPNDFELFAQICYKFNNWPDLVCPSFEANPAHPENNLKVLPGLGWQYMTAKFNSGNNTSLRIVLRNNSSDIDFCRDDQNDTACGINGYSLFDEIMLKPVLKVKNQNPADNSRDFISRTCRLYPDFDSLACSYFEDSVLHQGIFGYCLTPDPNNLKQCLQWWPVDQIKGELANEVMPDQIQSPLFYCVEKGYKSVFGGSPTLGSFDSESLQGDMTDAYGYPATLVPFDINEDYRPIFRYPYIKDLSLSYFFPVHEFPVRVLQRDPNNNRISLLTFYFYFGEKVETSWGICSDNGADCKISDKSACDNPAAAVCDVYPRLTLGPGGSSGVTLLPIKIHVAFPLDLITNNGLLFDYDVAVVQDWMSNNLLAAGVDLTFNFYYILTAPSFEAAIDGTAADTKTAIAVASMLGGFVTNLGIAAGAYATGGQEWEDDVAPSFSEMTASYGMDSNAVDIAFGSLVGIKLATEQDPVYGKIGEDPVPDIPMDIYGGVVVEVSEADEDGPSLGGNFKSSTSTLQAGYCSKVVQVVTSAGLNKAWSGRVFPGSKYVLSDSKSRTNYFVYYSRFNYNEFLANVKETVANGYTVDQHSYQSSDFKPFGAMVPPANSQYPENWDSRETSYIQPVFYEPPLVSMPEPYQARMGEDHTTNSLKRIFLKNYGVWKWDEGDPTSPIDDHYLPLVSTDPAYANYSWNIINDWDNASPSFPDSGYCPGNDRPFDPSPPLLDDATLCRVRPMIDPLNISINDNSLSTIGDGDVDAIISGAGAIKLSFTVKVDPNQLPINSYSVDWGDGEISAASGIALRARPNLDNPFVLYHSYDFWQLRRRCNDLDLGVSEKYCTDKAHWDNGTSMLYCPDEDSCQVRLRIKVRDNWNAETCLPNVANEADCAAARCSTSMASCDAANPCPAGETCLSDKKYIPLIDYVLVQPNR